MAIAGLTWCDFVVYTLTGMHAERVNFNSTLWNRLAPVLKTIFHQCVISYTCGQSYSDGSVLRAIRVRLATGI